MTTLPRWLADVERLLPIRSQFVLSGNIRDLAIVDVGDAPVLVPLVRALWERLAAQGYRFIVLHDVVEGVRIYPNDETLRKQASEWLQLPKADGAAPMGLEALAQLAAKVASLREARCALLLDYASRIARAPGSLDAGEHRFFVAMEKLAATAAPIVPQAKAETAPKAEADRSPRFNPILWLVESRSGPALLVPARLRAGEHAVIPRPDYEDPACRRACCSGRCSRWLRSGRSAAVDTLGRAFADNTDGMTLSSMGDIVAARGQSSRGIGDIDDAIRCYKVGALDNPWKKDYLKDRIRNAMSGDRGPREGPAPGGHQDGRHPHALGDRAHRRAGALRLRRPRGILFFAGPTGVGKTELAKTLTQIIFGDERAYIRFDMSEFAEEHSAARLLGAPPGYVGYDAGGELTNAMREKPFSVVLFDEIEKAHPRILDKFLQILEDGRLTDGRGDTVYFSEAIIIFTSNLGIYVEARRPPRAERAPGRLLRDGRAQRARGDLQSLPLYLIAPGDPQPDRREHRRLQLHRARDRREDPRRHAAQRRAPGRRKSMASSSRSRTQARATPAGRLSRRPVARRTRHRQPARDGAHQSARPRALRTDLAGRAARSPSPTSASTDKVYTVSLA
jgi:ATP-dependent Clp protease ATP-binding subunit ClpB